MKMFRRAPIAIGLLMLCCSTTLGAPIQSEGLANAGLVPAAGAVVNETASHSDLDIVWLLVCSFLVFVMQAGFMCLEAGLSRAKNSIHVAFKNVADLSFSVITFWLFGFGLMFGSSYYGWFGTSLFAPSVNGDYWLAAFFVFQAMFCATVSTIDSGAVAERASLSSYILASKVVCTLIYPVLGHWIWGGLFFKNQSGWLESLGFLDCAGATVVHSTGGWVALAGIIVIGPRIGKFNNGVPTTIRGHNIPLMFLGMFVLFFGWFGFTCGSTFETNASVAGIAMNTLLAGCFAGVVSGALGCVFSGQPDPVDVANGILGGLVAVAAGCLLLEPIGAAIVGSVAALFVFFGTRIIERKFQLDDVVGAVAVHGLCGAWGTVGLALLIPATGIPDGFTRMHLLGVQSLGVLVCFGWSFGLAYCFLKAASKLFPLRVSEEAERIGLNIAEHNASSGFLDLQQSLGSLIEGDLQSDDIQHLKVEPEPGTEVGDLAVVFNEMVDALQLGREELFASSEREELLNKLVVASREAGMAEIAVGMLHNVGNALNSLTVSTGVVRDSVKSSSVSRLRAAYEVLDSHRDDLAGFLTEDPKGKHFLDFLNSLCDRLESETQMLGEEISTMALSVDNLKSIVSKQEEYASLGGGAIAPEYLPNLVDEAVKMLHQSFARHDVAITCECDQVSKVMQDKRSIIQVLTHLLRNADHAVTEHDGGARLVNVRVWEEDEMVCCSVQDTGIGIKEELIDTIFQYGFTTRKEHGGQGFGLHSSANAIQEMGGTITAASQGLGLGATFTIQIPAWRNNGLQRDLPELPSPHPHIRPVAGSDDAFEAPEQRSS